MQPGDGRKPISWPVLVERLPVEALIFPLSIPRQPAFVPTKENLA
ncbi:MAG: hypothetical protein ACLU9S_19125 [Oscillospiraceae bacterium]